VASLIDTYASGAGLSYTLPTVQDGDELFLFVNRVTSFAVSYTPAGFVTSLDTVAGCGIWHRVLSAADTGTTIELAVEGGYAAWIVRDAGAWSHEVVFGAEDNFSAVSFPRTIPDNDDQGTPPFADGVHLAAGFGFYSPTTGTPGTYGEARLVSIDGYTPDENATHEFVETVTPFRNVSFFVATMTDLSGNPDPIDWTYTVSVGGPRTRLEVVRLILAVQQTAPHWGVLARPV
jgi:hypothetical protein